MFVAVCGTSIPLFPQVAPELLNVDGARLGRMSVRMWLLSLLLESVSPLSPHTLLLFCL